MLTRDELYAIIEQHVMVTDAWGGSKLANWQYGYDVMVGGIDEAVDAIMAAITPAPPPTDAPDEPKVADCDGNTVTQ